MRLSSRPPVEPDAAGLAKVVLVLLLLLTWWMYDGYVLLTNAVAVDVRGHRLLLIGGMAGFLIMALAIPTTFSGGGAAFGAAYVAVVALHAGLYIRETSTAEARAMSRIAPYNILGAVLVVTGGIVGGDLQWVLFTVAPLLLWVALPFLISLEGLRVSAAHFVERHRLVVIVALGESIVVLGVGADGARVDLKLAMIALLSLALSAASWWTYFGQEEAIEHAWIESPAADRPRLALLAGTYGHLVLLLGIVLLSSGLKKAIGHPVDPLEGLVAVELATGAALFVAAAGAILRVLRVDDGVASRGAMIAAALATIPLGLAVSAAAQVAALAAIVIAGAVVAGEPHRLARPIGVPAPAE